MSKEFEELIKGAKRVWDVVFMFLLDFFIPFIHLNTRILARLMHRVRK